MILCSHCGAANRDGSAYCQDCGTELAPQGINMLPLGACEPIVSAAAPTVRCSSCGTMNHLRDTFCSGCGGRLDYSPGPPSTPSMPVATAAPAEAESRETAFFGAAQNVCRARLVVIRGGSFEGASYDLNAEQLIAGRTEGEILFPDDDFLSPRHAEFRFRGSTLVARDLNSLNGLYRRMTGKVTLNDGDGFVVGEQVFRFRRSGEPVPLPGFIDPGDETLHLGGPAKDVGPFCVEQILRGGQLGHVYYPPMGEMTLGRDGCDLNFPLDGHLSRQHARLYLEDERVVFEDMKSKNGSFLRVRGEIELRSGDLLFLGHQLLRVEIIT